MKRLQLTLTLTLLSFTLLSAQSNEAKIAYNKALQHFNGKNYDLAFPHLSDAILSSPDFEAAHHLLAVCYEEKENIKGAINSYEKVLELNSKQEKVLYNLSLLYAKSKQDTKAINSLEQALKINPGYTKASQRLERLKSAQVEARRPKEEPIKQVETARTVSSTKPKETKVSNKQYNVGVAFQNDGDYHSAIAAYEKAIREGNTQAQVYFNLGLSYYEEKELPNAIK